MNTIRFSEMESPLGLLRLRGTEHGLTGIFMENHRHGPEANDQTHWQWDDVMFEESRRQLSEYFSGRRTMFDLAIDRDALGGTPFQRRVWSELEKIPYGVTISYGELAARIGNRGAVRAVGLANGRNPISIVVPCHRVIGANRTLTGYGGGLERKRWLLDLEGGGVLQL
ncbi:methylated-DNA--[protein]-cysteine S-methyltransferase [Verrucomicrobiota bacterium sgz303538]